MNSELIPLNLLIADRTYRVRIDPKDEEVVQRWEQRFIQLPANRLP